MQKPPVVSEVALRKPYRFMYANFVIATQHDVYLLLEKNADLIDAIQFGFLVLKYGYPNDEALGGHPLAKHGLGFYGLYEVTNSPWIEDIMTANRAHPRHNDALFSRDRHFIGRFKDVTLEVICTTMREVQLGESDLSEIVKEQIGYLSNG
jgi:hypothetical protein